MDYTARCGWCAMYRTLFNPDEIPADIREFFEETSAACGKQWVRQATSEIEFTQRVHNHPKYGDDGQFQHQAANRHADGHVPGRKITTTTGWAASCTCSAGAPVPATVLDP